MRMGTCDCITLGCMIQKKIKLTEICKKKDGRQEFALVKQVNSYGKFKKNQTMKKVIAKKYLFVTFKQMNFT